MPVRFGLLTKWWQASRATAQAKVSQSDEFCNVVSSAMYMLQTCVFLELVPGVRDDTATFPVLAVFATTLCVSQAHQQFMC